MPKRLETAKERLSIFDAEPRQQKPVDTREILGLPKRENPVPQRERKNPRVPTPQSFPRPEDAIRSVDPKDISSGVPESPEQIQQMINQHQQKLIEIEGMLARPDVKQNPQQQNQILQYRNYYLNSLEYLKSLMPSYPGLVQKGEIPAEEAIAVEGDESLQDVARKRKDVAEFAETKQPEAPQISSPEEILDRRLNEMQAGDQIRSVYQNDAALIADNGRPQKSFQWQKDDEGNWAVKNSSNVAATKSDFDQLITNTMKVVQFFSSHPELWKDEYATIAMQTQNGIGSLLNLVNAITKDKQQEMSPKSPMYLDDEGVTPLGEEPQEAPSYEPAGADQLSPEQIAEQEAIGVSPEDSETEQAIEDVASGTESPIEEDMLVEEAEKFEPRSRKGKPKLKLDEVNRFVPRMEMPSAKNIEADILRAASVEGATIAGRPISKYVETDEAGNAVGLSREGRDLRRDLMRGEIFDYLESLIYREPQLDQNGNQIPDPVSDLIKKSLYYNAYRIDNRSLDADPQKTLDGMANLVLYDVMNAIENREARSLFVRWPDIEKRGMERGQSFEEAVGRWLTSQAYGTRLRVNRHYSRPRYTDEYRKWMNARRTVTEIANSEYPIPTGATKDEANAIRLERKRQIGNWLQNNPEPSERYVGISSMEGFFENLQPDEAQEVVQDWSGEIPKENEQSITKEIGPQIESVRNALADKPKQKALFEFLIQNPELFRLEEQQVDEKPEAQWNKEFEDFQNSDEYKQKLRIALQRWEANNVRPKDKAELEAWGARRDRQAELVKRQMNSVYRDTNPKPKSIPVKGIEVSNWKKVAELWNSQNPEDQVSPTSLKKRFDLIKNLFNNVAIEEEEAADGEEAKEDIGTPGTRSFPFGDKETLGPEAVPLNRFDSLREQMGINSNVRQRIARIRSLLNRKG